MDDLAGCAEVKREAIAIAIAIAIPGAIPRAVLRPSSSSSPGHHHLLNYHINTQDRQPR